MQKSGVITFDLIKKIVVGGFILGVVLVLGFFVWVFTVTQDLPSAQDLANYEPPITSRVHAGDGKLVAEFASQHRVYVPSEELPDKLINAFISAEDKSFFEHSGVNLVAMLRGTVWNAVRGRRMTGGSTITQQTVKNMLTGNERSAERKIREAILAQRLEKQFTKHQILELYMNEIYLGGRSYGVGAAALNYFGKSLSELTIAEAAMLAALPQAPSRVNPYNRPEAAVERRNWVISRMAINGYITEAEATEAQAEPLTTVARLDTDENEASAYYVEELRREILRLGEARELEGFRTEEEATKAFYEGGLSIRSTLDTQLQLAAQTALRAGLETYDRRHGWRGPIGAIEAGEGFVERLKTFVESDGGKAAIAGAGNTWQTAVVQSAGDRVSIGLADGQEGSLAAADITWASKYSREGGSGLKRGDVILVSRVPTPDATTQKWGDYANKKEPTSGPWHIRQIPSVQGALVAMDPHTGRVLAMAGGYSFRRSQFDRAVQAQRQPGSSFKPFVYSAAMENGWTPASLVLDAPYVHCDETQDECYKPSNYTDQFYGMQTLRFGVEQSKNPMTVRLATDMGLEQMSEIGERMGVYDNLPPYEAMALGAGETTPLRLVTGYAELVNGGKRVEPILMDRIQNRYGETVYKTDDRLCTGCNTEWSPGLQPPALPDEREQILDPVTAYQMVSILEGVVQRGTGRSIQSVGVPIAAKTGTTNDFIDAWTVGFSPDLVAGVWIGFDTPKKMGEGESGGRVAGPVYRDFMTAALKNSPGLPFRIPPGVRLVEIDAETGCLPSATTRLTILEAFKPGTEPTGRCESQNAVQYRPDYSDIQPGDESITPGPGGAIDPFAPQQPAEQPQEELTLSDGIF